MGLREALQYLNPKREAASEIAAVVVGKFDDKRPEGTMKRMWALEHRDKGLHEMVVEELGKLGFSYSSDKSPYLKLKR